MNKNRHTSGTIYYSLRCRKRSKSSDEMVDAGPCVVECEDLFWDPYMRTYHCGCGRGVRV